MITKINDAVRIASDEDAAMLIRQHDFNPTRIKSWLEQAPAFTTSYSRSGGGRKLILACSILDRDLSKDLAWANGSESEFRSAWYLLALAAGLEDHATWIRNYDHVESYDGEGVIPFPSGRSVRAKGMLARIVEGHVEVRGKIVFTEL